MGREFDINCAALAKSLNLRNINLITINILILCEAGAGGLRAGSGTINGWAARENLYHRIATTFMGNCVR